MKTVLENGADLLTRREFEKHSMNLQDKSEEKEERRHWKQM